MAQVPDKVLAWLYSVLHEYQDPQRTYSDAARALSAYPSISPRTEVYTHENGASALLLTLSGTLPVSFRGSTYRFPIKLWLPHAYPQDAPIVYVEPGKEMLIRPGQHVGVDGRVYHPYLRDWRGMWDRAGLQEFFELLQQVFAKEPPVISRAQQQQFQRPLGGPPQQGPGAAGPPQLPPKQRVGSLGPAPGSGGSSAPPVPPKPGEECAQSSRDVRRDGPPLPPLPHELAQRSSPAPTSHQTYQSDYMPPTQGWPAPTSGYHNGRPPGPAGLVSPPPQQASHQHQQYQPRNRDSPVSPVSPVNGHSNVPHARYAQPSAHQLQGGRQSGPYPPEQHYPYPPQHQPNPQYPYQYQHPPQPQKKQPAPDLLSDPFEVALPGASIHGPPAPAPPIPPNPEKEHLLQAISATLVQQAQQKVNQSLSAIAPLQAQQQALYTAQERLKAEIRQLEQLDQTLSNNEAILHRSIQDCDRTIETAKSKKQPPIDEVLIAPTMVANQLWTLCAEEAACREAMYVLQKANDRGRISGNDFVRQMRGLGRECFLKMALARKCAKGMGLEIRR
ncbi:ESCRT-I component like protein [Zymoseptoria brevis]|uniref:ESCRT-I component like protein n=1 Tax=Zymoseptoria brevis TaxID=1047168 RepID=A0A0F4G735_9PEZI|nr:ESCRT-I component like protein [Zymoseptoria brevis]